MPCLLYASKPSRVILKGGTNADMAPPIDYMREVGEHTAFGSVHWLVPQRCSNQWQQSLESRWNVN